MALFNNIDGAGNTAFGHLALGNNTGSGNIGIGLFAGKYLTTGTSNIDIGSAGGAGESATIRIGDPAAQNQAFIAGIYGSPVADGPRYIVVDASGRLGTVVSSRRFKEDIRDMSASSEAILALRPVTFRYKRNIDPQGADQFGLIAEEVEKVNPALVIHDPQGKAYSVRYDAVNAMLLNEFLKEHAKVSDLKTTVADLAQTIAEQQQAIKALTASLKEQASLIQKVSAQMEAGKPEPRMAVNSN